MTRSIAILGALTLHALLTFKVWDQVPPGLGKAVGNGFFRSCTPTFFLLFGVMLEWIYVRQRERDGAAAVARRLSLRALQCYLGMALGAAAAVLGGGLTVEQLPQALFGLVDVPMSSVLRFYAFAMLLCIPVVLLRPRLGPTLPLVLVLVIWVVAPLLPLLPWPATGSRWAFLTAFLVGQPPQWIGGSLWHGMSLVFLGMALGYHMRARLDTGQPPLGGWPVVLLVAGCIAGTLMAATQLGLDELAQGYLGTAMHLRVACHPAYFTIAVLSSLGLMWCVQRAFPVGAAMPPRWPFMALGRHSLLAFALGNAALNALAGWHPPFWLALAETALFLVILCLGVMLVDRRGKV